MSARIVRQTHITRGVELGQIREDLDAAIVLDAIYGPLWTRLTIAHLPLSSVHATKITAAIWPGNSTNWPGISTN